MPEYGSDGGYTVVMAGPFASSGGGTGKLTTISAPVANWKGGTSPYSQVIAMDDISVNSKIDIQLSADQIELFRGLDIAFTVENRGGEATLVAVGDKPSADCVFQATASEVLIVGNMDGTVILGNTVKTTSFQKTGGDMSKPINMNSQNLYGLKNPMTDDAAANKGYVDASKEAANDYTKAQVKKAASPNLLINPYFRDPVNQRGKATYAVKKELTIDGWYDVTDPTTQLTVSIKNGYTQLSRNATAGNVVYVQQLEKLLNGKYTFAIWTEHGVTTNVINFTGESKDWTGTDVLGHWWINLNSESTYPCVRIVNTTAEASTLNLYGAGLFEGEHTAETIREYLWVDKGDELLKCMRYFVKTKKLYQAVASSTGIVPGVQFPVPMRVAPTVTVYDADGNKDHISVWTSSGISSVAVSQVPTNESGIYYIDADVPANALCGYSYEADAELR